MGAELNFQVIIDKQMNLQCGILKTKIESQIFVQSARPIYYCHICIKFS
jgi:hypothetical protein